LIVIAALNNEPLIKTLCKEGEQFILRSENAAFAPRYALESDELLIWGGSLQRPQPFSCISITLTRAAEKLRGQQHLGQSLQVFIQSSPFDERGERYSRSVLAQLPYPTSDTRDLVAAALQGLAGSTGRARYTPRPV